MTQIRIGGVPEHFNTPWKYAMDQQVFAKAGLDVAWIEYADGTGAMCRDLSQHKLDLAVVLTEGIIAHCVNQGDTKIIAPYVTTPLIWGIYVRENAAIQSIADLPGKTFAVSRFGSGSHLMSLLLAQAYRWDPHVPLPFKAVGGIQQLGAALKSGSADVFLWEVFTTAPYLETYALKKVGEIPTPWPCFHIAAHEKMLTQPQKLKNLLGIILAICADFNKDPAVAVRNVCHYYGMPVIDAASWMQKVSWATDCKIDANLITQVQNALLQANIISRIKPAQEIVAML